MTTEPGIAPTEKMFIGSPCKTCGSTVRYINSNSCVSCIKRQSAIWKKNNVKRINELSNVGYHDRVKKFHQLCRKHVKRIFGLEEADMDVFYASYVPASVKLPKLKKKRDKEAAKLANKRWIENNIERRREIARNSQKRHPDTNRASARNRHAKKIAALGFHTPQDIAIIFTAQRGRCAYCRETFDEDFHVDHIVPLSTGGTNWPANLQVVCPRCNMKKHAKDPIDFAREMGLLI